MIDPSSSEEESDEDQGGRGSGKHSTPNHHQKHVSHPKSLGQNVHANQHVASAGPASIVGRQNLHSAGGGNDGGSMSGNAMGPMGAQATQHMSHHTAPNHQPHHSHPNAKEIQNSHLHHASSDTSGSLEVPNNTMPSGTSQETLQSQSVGSSRANSLPRPMSPSPSVASDKNNGGDFHVSIIQIMLYLSTDENLSNVGRINLFQVVDKLMDTFAWCHSSRHYSNHST